MVLELIRSLRFVFFVQLTMLFKYLDPHESTSQRAFPLKQMRSLALGFLADRFDKHITAQMCFCNV